MKKFLILMILAATLATACAEGLTFNAISGSFAGTALPYRKAVNEGSGNGKYALMIYLHGGSSKGNDNTKQMGEKGIDSIANYIVRHQMRAVFVVPQCPADKSWGGPMLGVLKGLIDECMQNPDMDRNRIYIFGGSMGGTGTWSMLSNYPGLFTAAMPVAGNPSQCSAENVAKTPVLTVMGTSDRIMSVQTAADFIAQLNALGDETVFETEDGWTHEMTCIESYTDERVDWVVSHAKSGDSVEIVGSGKTVCSTEYFTIDGCRIDAPSNGLYIVRHAYSDGSHDAAVEYFH